MGRTVDCLLRLVWVGEGNIASDPSFVDAAAKDYRVRSTSSATNVGRRSHLPRDIADLDWDGDTTEPIPTDLGLKGRATGSLVDIGAFRRVSP